MTGSIESRQALQFWSSTIITAAAAAAPPCSPPNIHTLQFKPGSESIVGPALLQLRQSLPRPPSILIHDLIEGSGLIRQGALQEVLLVKSLLFPTATTKPVCLIPSAFTVHVQCIESYELLRQNQVYPDCTAGFSLETLNVLGVRKSRELDLNNQTKHRPLSAPHETLMVNLMDNMQQQQQAVDKTTHDEIARTGIKIPIVAGGQCHAVAFWFSLQMDQETFLSTGPSAINLDQGRGGSSYRQGAILVGGGMMVVKIGDVLNVDVICTLSRGIEIIVNR